MGRHSNQVSQPARVGRGIFLYILLNFILLSLYLGFKTNYVVTKLVYSFLELKKNSVILILKNSYSSCALEPQYTLHTST